MRCVACGSCDRAGSDLVRPSASREGVSDRRQRLRRRGSGRKDRRVDHLIEEGLARRQGQRVIFASDLLNTLRRRELDDAVARLSAETGPAHRPSAEGKHVAGAYRQRVTLAALGRLAVIDDGLEFQLVPWRPALEQKLGQHVSGTLTPGGGVDWSLGRSRGLGL
jgi:Protein of unknown function (DUF3363)